MRSDLIRFALLNTRSIRKKAMFLKDYVVENQIDLLAITETWLDVNNQQTANIINELCPVGFGVLRSHQSLKIPNPMINRLYYQPTTMVVYLHLVEFHLSLVWLDIINLVQGAVVLIWNDFRTGPYFIMHAE